MTTTHAGNTDEEQIRTVIAERATAMRERDADRYVAQYAPEIVKFDLAPPLLLTGPKARDADSLRAWFASHLGGPIDYEIRGLTLMVGGDVAFCHSLNQLGGALWFRSTLGLRKSTARGESRTSTTRPRSTWTALTRPPSTCSRNPPPATTSAMPSRPSRLGR